jgi:hypothetical protein
VLSARTVVEVRDTNHPSDTASRGTALLSSDLTEDQLAAAPVMTSLDALLIDGLSDKEDQAFAAAIAS